jgi:hypothetical protein
MTFITIARGSFSPLLSASVQALRAGVCAVASASYGEGSGTKATSAEAGEGQNLRVRASFTRLIFYCKFGDLHGRKIVLFGVRTPKSD